MSRNHKFWKRIKHVAMVLIWRVQQIAAIATLVITALTLTLQVSGKLDIGVGNPYLRILVVFTLLVVVILMLGYLWDVKGKLWVEQIEVVVERNPYMTYHMTAKEIVSNLTMWIPLYEATGIHESARIMEDWCKEALSIDPKVKPISDKIIQKFKCEQFIREKYPWYGE